ncbi:Probable LysR-type transcriptional regulator [Bifidobacterium bifidum]|nr:Probable LysR-type transcriptional regulator [Bifidobacterium bifidum]
MTGSRRRRDRHRRRWPVILGALPVPTGQSAGHRRTHRRHAVPPSRIRSRGCGPGTSYAISFGISACDYRWSAVDDFIDRARRSISTIDRHDSGRNRRITPDSR